MKYIASLFIAVFMLATTAMTAQQARLQVIHNAADPAAASVDLYVNGTLFQDDFAFRAATPFVDVPAGVQLSIGVAPGSSTGAQDIIAAFDVTLDDGKTYIAVANGVLDPMAFAANPDMKSTAFTLFTTDMGQESAMNASEVDLAVLHGSTDAPAVDVIARGVTTLVDDAAYGDMTPYFAVPAGSYTLDITPAMDNNTIVASFTADLSGLAGGAAVVFASGFLNPAANQSGPAFGLYAALPDGNVVALPAYKDPMARLQVIHNAADPAAASVDLYVNGTLFQDDFAFRTATPFVDVPAGVQLSIGVAPGSSTGAQDIIATFDVTLDDGKTYIAMASGVLAPMSFADNPDNRPTGFQLYIKENARDRAQGMGVDLTVFHGATDAPTVDVIARDVATLVDDAAYGDFTTYFNVPADRYILDVTPGDDNATIVASFDANLSSLDGGSAVVFASGFLAPETNNDGAPFGLYAALSDGTVLVLSSPTSITDDASPLPVQSMAVYPNPARGQATLNFSLDSDAAVTLRMFDMSGREVFANDRGQLAPGSYDAALNTAQFAPGMYRVMLSTSTGVSSTMVSVVR